MSRAAWGDLSSYPARHREAIERKLQQTTALRDQVIAESGGRAVEPSARRKHPEQDLQIAIVTLADMWPMPLTIGQAAHWPDVVTSSKVGDWLYHTPNGMGRTPAEAGILKAMGLRPGVADLFLMLPVFYANFASADALLGPAARHRAGLYTELKAGAGRLTDSQRDFAARARAVGYEVSEARSVEEWQGIVGSYLYCARPLNPTTKE